MINKRQSGLTSVAEDSTDRQGSDQLTDRMVSEINALCKTATLQFALSVGDLVIQRLYLGDMDRWRSRDPTKKMSLRKIARHPSLAMLYGCIAIYELCERLDIKTWRHISTSHMRLALPLKHEEQARLLRLAESDRWSVRRLEEEVAALTRGCMPEQKGGALTSFATSQVHWPLVKQRCRFGRCASRIGGSHRAVSGQRKSRNGRPSTCDRTTCSRGETVSAGRTTRGLCGSLSVVCFCSDRWFERRTRGGPTGL